MDKLSDIYSLGVTLYQMVTGKAPYEGQTNQFKIQLSIVSNPFPKAKQHYPGVSDKIEAIIEKATQKKKSDRFQSCEEFIKSFGDGSILNTQKKKEAQSKTEKTKKIQETEIQENKNESKVIDSKPKLKIISIVLIIILLTLASKW